MFCKECGKQLNDEQRFCPECGTENKAYIDKSIDPSVELEKKDNDNPNKKANPKISTEEQIGTLVNEDDKSNQSSIDAFNTNTYKENKTKKSHVVLLIIVFILIMVSVGLTLALINKSKQESKDDATTSTQTTTVATTTQQTTQQTTQIPTMYTTVSSYVSNLEALVLQGNVRYYTSMELASCSDYELSILRNGLFALSGKRFTKNQEVISFFENCSWYRPDSTDDRVVQARWNKYQVANLDLIMEYERE